MDCELCQHLMNSQRRKNLFPIVLAECGGNGADCSDKIMKRLRVSTGALAPGQHALKTEAALKLGHCESAASADDASLFQTPGTRPCGELHPPCARWRGRSLALGPWIIGGHGR